MHKNITLIKPFVLILGISLVLGSFFQYYLEATGKSDSIGFLYSGYCSIIHSIIITIPVMAIYCIYRSYAPRRHKKAKEE
jgi:uncharacterized BrkB/YihY/UPF0761 family membrane protein